jgi:hypothetical protein
MFSRPIRSDNEDQPIRPAMFEADSTATKPAAADAVTGVEVCAKKSVAIGAAFSRTAVPGRVVAVDEIRSPHTARTWGGRQRTGAGPCRRSRRN